jgi:hypothetical protein
MMKIALLAAAVFTAAATPTTAQEQRILTERQMEACLLRT